MRRSTVFFATALFLLPMLTACEGPIGPAGSTGPAGSAGPAGPVGPAGQDVNENCTQCHTGDVNLYAKQVQWAKSGHGVADALYDRTSCSVCHSHQGFLERVETGEWETAATVTDVVGINCRTCHQLHTTYTSADYAFTVDEVALRVAGVTVDLGGSSNLCASCHQSRLRDPMAVIDGDPLELSSGPHHGPQGGVMAGLGLYNFNGTTEGMHTHGSLGGCATCHMADASETAGGHTFTMGSNTAGCESSGCHSEVDDFEHFGLQDDVQTLLDELAVALGAAGALEWDAEDLEWSRVRSTEFPANVAAAYWNYMAILEDRSLGIHNPSYVKGILEGSIAEIE